MSTAPFLKPLRRFLPAALSVAAVSVFAFLGVASNRAAQTTQQQKPVMVAKLGIPNDETVAELRHKAERGDAGAQYILGSYYANGRGVPRDYAQAAGWYRTAAEQGHAEAQLHLGELCARGQGVSQDYTQAAVWYLKAAEQGDFDAEYLMGILYQTGEGVSQDHVEAYKWLSLAIARASDIERMRAASGVRDRLATKMNPAQVAEAQKRASEWTAAFENRKK